MKKKIQNEIKSFLGLVKKFSQMKAYKYKAVIIYCQEIRLSIYPLLYGP